MRLGIYGGTFSPIHNAHIRVAKAFCNQFELDKLMVIPAGVPPHKQIIDNDDPQSRLEMCRLAFEGCKRIEVSDMELLREGKSYTVITLRELTAPDRDLYFLCGTDMILTFDRWFCFEEIFKLCTLVYVRRENDEAVGVELDKKIHEYRTRYGAKIKRLDTDPLELSSTEVRNAVKKGLPISNMVPESIERYIKDRGLYGG